jgi:hypothetical protein
VLAIDTTPDSVAIATNFLSTLQEVANLENKTRIVTKIRILLIEHQNIELVWSTEMTQDCWEMKRLTKKREAQQTARLLTIRHWNIKTSGHQSLHMRNRRWNEENKKQEHKYLVANGRDYLTGRRVEDVLVSRSRIGYFRLTHGYLMVPMAKRVDPVCQHCRRDLTMRHILVDTDNSINHEIFVDFKPMQYFLC